MNLQTVKPRARHMPSGQWLVTVPLDDDDELLCTIGDTLDTALRSTHEFLLQRAIVSPSHR